MKSPGIVRKVDDLGRIVIPMEIRKNFDISPKDSLEIYVEEDNIILRKYEVKYQCAICGNSEVKIAIKGKSICEECLSELTNK